MDACARALALLTQTSRGKKKVGNPIRGCPKEEHSGFDHQLVLIPIFHCMYSVTSLDRPLLWETTCPERPGILWGVHNELWWPEWVFLAEGPPVSREHIFVANGMVLIKTGSTVFYHRQRNTPSKKNKYLWASETRQSVALQRDGAARLAKKIPIITHSGNAFLSNFYSKKPQPYLSGKLPHRKQFTLVLKTTPKKLFLKYQCKNGS